MGAAAQFVVVTVALSPLLLVAGDFDVRSVGSLFVIGALGLAPALTLCWKAIARTDPSTVSVIGLNEAVVASVVAGVTVPGNVTTGTVVAGALILAAVGSEMVSQRRKPALDTVESGT